MTALPTPTALRFRLVDAVCERINGFTHRRDGRPLTEDEIVLRCELYFHVLASKWELLALVPEESVAQGLVAQGERRSAERRGQPEGERSEGDGSEGGSAA